MGDFWGAIAAWTGLFRGVDVNLVRLPNAF